MTKRSLFNIFMGVCILCAPLSCTRRAARPKGGAAAKSTATVAGGRILNFHSLGEPKSLDPALMNGNTDHLLSMALFDGLVEYDPKTVEPVPSIAERWEISPDGKVYTFHLREAKWSDGHPITAHDFVYSWERALNPKTGSQYAFALAYIKNAEAYNAGKLTDAAQLGFQAVDDRTLRVELVGPTPFFLNLLGMYVFRPTPRWAIEKYGDQWTRPEHIVTSGPFLLKTWVPQKEIVVVKNPTYWDAANVKGAGIRYHPIDSNETAQKMYDAGQLDIQWSPSLVKIPSLMGRPDYIEAPFLTTYFYWLNTTLPALKDARVRRALAMAIDRQVLCDNYLHKTRTPITTYVPAGLRGYMPPPGPEFNPETARRLFAEAGFSDPSTFPTLTIKYNTDENHKLIAEVIQQMWKQHLGITVRLQNEEFKTLLKDLGQKDYDIGRFAWIADYPDPNTFLDLFMSTSSQNWSGWANPKFDESIRAAGQEPSEPKRFELLRQAEAIALEDLPVLPIFLYKRMMLVKPSVHGFYANILDMHPAKWMYIE